MVSHLLFCFSLNYSFINPSSSSTIPATAPETDDATTTTVIITINKINAKNVNKNPSGVIPLPQPFIPDISFHANNISIA